MSSADGGAALAGWFAARGGRLGSVAIKRHGGLRGLHAMRDMPAGALVLQVPRPLFFSRQTAGESAAVRQLAGVPKLSDPAVIGAGLALERRRAGRWRPLLDAMPTAFRERPDGYERADWDLLKGSHAQLRARQGWRTLLREHEVVLARLSPADRLPLREFAWGYLAASTRAFGLNVDGAQLGAIVPMADMLNHALDANCESNEDQSVSFELRTTRPVKAGTPLTICYGALPNTSLLARYGFCLADNPHDRATMHLSFDPSHWMYAASVATNGGEAVRGLCIGRDPLDEHGLRLFTFLRLAALSRERALQEPALNAVEDAGHLAVVGIDVEAEVLVRLASECERRLQQFPDAMAKDDALLAKARLTPAQRDAITVRRGEKQLLHEAIGQSRRIAAALCGPREQCAHALEAISCECGTWRGYVDLLLEHLRQVRSIEPAAEAPG